MDNNGKVVETSKTLVEFNESTKIIPFSSSSVVEKESCSLDLTCSNTSMGVRFSKSQDNGSSGVSQEDSIHDSNNYNEFMDGRGNGGGGGGGAGAGSGSVGDGDNLSVARVEKVVGEESGADDGGMENRIKESKDGDTVDGIAAIGDDGVSGDGAKIQDGRSCSERKPSADVLSSIAQRTRNRVVSGKIEDIGGVDVEGKGSEIGDEVDDEDNVFRVGDFVWGKVKSHPWWPGRIYDPSNASEFALKYKHEGRLLVSYFGDRTFAWCDPSQLKSFEDNFEEMSKQSSMKTFVIAVEEAQNEYGRLVRLQMTCSCVRESQSPLPLVVNAGVKEGVCMPENGIQFSIDQFKSSAILADINNLSTCVSVANKLELTVLKSELLAFYHAKFGYSLPIYCEPISIEDPLNEQGVPREASFRGPDDEDWFTGPEDQMLSQNGLLTPLDMSQKRRKSKTITELLGIETKDEVEGISMDRAEGEGQSGKSVVKSRKKRLKVSVDVQSSMHEENGYDSFSKDDEQSGKVVPKSGRKKRKTVDENRSHADNLVITRSSTRKKKESSARSIISDEKAAGDAVEKAADDTKEGGEVKYQKKRGTVPQVAVNGGPAVEEGYERISPRERKLSKYLSPPYTNLLQRQKSSCSQTRSGAGGLVFSDADKMGERMTKTASKLVGSTPLLKCSAETLQKPSRVLRSKHEKTDHPDYNTGKPDLSAEAKSPKKSIGSLNCVLPEIRSVALDPLNRSRAQSLDSVKEFVSSYRSSNYKNGSNYKVYKKGMPDDQRRRRKRNSSGILHGSDSDQKVLKEVDLQTPKSKISKRSATKRGPKPQPGHEAPCGSSLSPATLVITFPAGFSLPTKEEIIKMCCNFGVLDESKSEVVSESSTAMIVFTQSSYAEAAMDSMQRSASFGTTEVSYKIQLPAVVSSKGKQVNVQNKKKMISSETRGVESPDKHPSVSPPPESEPLAVIFIKQKLEAMTSMLGQSDGKMSDEIKSNLENEVKELLKKVKKMTATAS